MRRLEHLGVLDLERDQLVDVEEAAIVDVAARRAPEVEHVVLPLEQRAHALAPFLTLAPLAHRGERRRVPQRELDLGRIRRRIEREAVVEVAHARAVSRHLQRELAAPPARPPASRRARAAAPCSPAASSRRATARRTSARSATCGPCASTSSQYGLSAPIPMWFGTMSSTSPIPCCVRGLGQRDERRVAAELGIHLRRVGDVVPVRAPRARREHRRAVQVRHAERMQIWNARARVVERERAVELEAVGRGEVSRGCAGARVRECGDIRVRRSGRHVGRTSSRRSAAGIPCVVATGLHAASLAKLPRVSCYARMLLLRERSRPCDRHQDADGCRRDSAHPERRRTAPSEWWSRSCQR